MENHARFPIMVLRIEIRPEECSELEKLLLKIHGVHEVAIDRQKQKVTIVGDVNPLKLVKYIAKMGKEAELLVYDKKPKIDGPNPAQKQHKINNAQDSRHNHGNTTQHGIDDDHLYCKAKNSFRRYCKCGSSSKDVEEEELMFRERNGSFQRDYNHPATGEEFGGEADRRQHHGQFHSVHRNDKYRGVPNHLYHSASKGIEEEIYPNCKDQQYFHGRSRSSTGFVPTMDSEGGHDDRPPEHSTHHGKCQAAEEMNKQQGRYGQFYGRSRGTTNTGPDANYCSFPVPDDHHHRQHPDPAGNKAAQEEEKGGDGCQERSTHGRTRNAKYEYAQPSFHEAKFEEEIKEAKRDMNRFFTGMGGRSNNNGDHFFQGGSNTAYHHDLPRPNHSQWTRQEPLADEYYGDRNPRPPRQVYRARPGTHFDKFTNFFSDENPTSCTIV